MPLTLLNTERLDTYTTIQQGSQYELYRNTINTTFGSPCFQIVVSTTKVQEEEQKNQEYHKIVITITKTNTPNHQRSKYILTGRLKLFIDIYKDWGEGDHRSYELEETDKTTNLQLKTSHKRTLNVKKIRIFNPTTDSIKFKMELVGARWTKIKLN